MRCNICILVFHISLNIIEIVKRYKAKRLTFVIEESSYLHSSVDLTVRKLNGQILETDRLENGFIDP